MADPAPATPSTEIAVRDPELDRFARLGTWLALSEGGDGSPRALGAAAALRMFYAQELGLPPMAASELSVIHGKLFVQAKLLRALAARAGYRVRRVDSDETTCTAVLEDSATGREIGRSTFTFEQAKTAGLVRDRSAWQTHPARMLWARASKYVLDDYAPEVTLGLQTQEDELAEITGVPAPPPEPEPEPADDVEEADFTDLSDEPPPPDPTERPTAAEARAERPSEAAMREADEHFYTPEPIEKRQRDRISELFREKKISGRDERLSFVGRILGREVKSSSDLTKAEATKVIYDLIEYNPSNPQTEPLPEGF